jgi:beta-phosphoglucomutase-like phosphatase (HAD superfamily)
MEMRKGIIFDWIGTLAKNSDEIFPYSERVVRRLSGRYRISVISIAGFGIEKRCKEIDDSGLREYFDHVVVDEVKTPEQYLECMRIMKTNPRDTFVVDDRAFRGIKIGNQLGCKTYWIRNGRYSHETANEETGEPYEIINSVEDLLNIL